MINNPKKKFTRVSGIVLCLIMVFGLFFTTIINKNVKAENNKKAKNVILLIPDGMSIEASTLARLYNGGKPLAMDGISKGFIRTNWNQGPITDSAPAATAYATGHKSDDGHVGTAPIAEKDKPLATILEAAKLQGKGTGIVFTCEAMHATPADFTAHDSNRSNYHSLMTQQVFNGLDVVLGGGDDYFTTNKLYDGRTLKEVISSLGYKYITTRDEMMNSNSNKLWGMFAGTAMKYDFDRIASKDSREPSIEEMTNKAIDTLKKNSNGFFLMVEGSKIDWAAHANDPSGVVGDIMAFDKAVKAALDFAKNDGNTVVIVVADHGTGGISIGSSAVSKYSAVKFNESVDKLKSSKITTEYLETLTWDSNTKSRISDDNKIKEAMNAYGISDLTAEEMAAIKNAPCGGLAAVTAPMLSKRANVGWVYTGHVGGDVTLYNYGPANVEKLKGVVDNTEIGKYMARIMGVNLDDLTSKLFVNAKESFEALGAAVQLDTSSVDNPVLKVTKGSKELIIPVFANIVKINGKEEQLDGVTVCSSTYDSAKKLNVYSAEKIYVSQQAVEIFKESLGISTSLPRTGAIFDTTMLSLIGGIILAAGAGLIIFLRVEKKVEAEKCKDQTE